VEEKEKLATTAASVTMTEQDFGRALPRPRGRSAAVLSNTRKPVVLPLLAGPNRGYYVARPTAPGSAGSRRGMLGAGRGGRGLKTKAHTKRGVGVAEKEEAQADLVDKPISGSDTERLEREGSMRSRNRSKLDIGGSLAVGEWEHEEVEQGVESVKRVRSSIQVLGQIERMSAKGVAEGKYGKVPEKPDIVAGKKRSLEDTKTKGRPNFSAIAGSEEEGTEDEEEGSAKKKQRLRSVVETSDEDETEDELSTCPV
jgi:hypothetical protein